MRGFSKVVLAGNLTRDPEMRSTPSGAQVCGFSIAVNRQYKGADGNMQEQTSFIDCSAWGRPGETISQYLHKGSAVLVSGRLEQRSWDDKNTGQKRSKVEVIVDDFTFIGGGDANRGGYGDAGRGGYGDMGAGAPMSRTNRAASVANDFAPEDVPIDVPSEGKISEGDIPF